MLTNYMNSVFNLSILSILFLAAPVTAQEGFPLDGTWRGEWGSADGSSTHVVIVMAWDGQNINGVINPGRNSIDIKTAHLIPESWSITIGAEDRDGIPIQIQGQLDNIGSYNRSIEGTWTHGGTINNFTLTRE